MKDNIQFREDRSNDAQSINQVACDSWHAAYDSILGPTIVEETVQSWYDPDKLISNDILPTERPFFVTEINEQIVDFIEAVQDNNNDLTFHLYRIYVTPKYWGNEIGSTLLERIESLLREQNIERLQLSVLAENDGAIQFYHSQGFTRIDERYNEQLDVQEYEYAKSL